MFEITVYYYYTSEIYVIYGFQVMRIEDTPIKDISDGTFDGSLAESLEELYLINTWLTRVSPAIKVRIFFRIKSDILNIEMNYNVTYYFNFYFRI